MWSSSIAWWPLSEISLIPVATIVHIVRNGTNTTETSTITNEPPKVGTKTTVFSVEPIQTDAAGTAYAVIGNLDFQKLTSTTSTLKFPDFYGDYATSYKVGQGHASLTNGRQPTCTTYSHSTAILPSHPSYNTVPVGSKPLQTASISWGNKNGKGYVAVWQTAQIYGADRFYGSAFPTEVPFQKCTFGNYEALHPKRTIHSFLPVEPGLALSSVGYITVTSTSHAGPSLPTAHQNGPLQSLSPGTDSSKSSTSVPPVSPPPKSTTASSVQSPTSTDTAGGIISAIESAASACNAGPTSHAAAPLPETSSESGAGGGESPTPSKPPESSTASFPSTGAAPGGLVSAVESAAAVNSSPALTHSVGSEKPKATAGGGSAPPVVLETDTGSIQTPSVSPEFAPETKSSSPSGVVSAGSNTPTSAPQPLPSALRGAVSLVGATTIMGGKPSIIPAIAVGSQIAPVGSTITVSNMPIAVVTSSSRTFFVVGSHGTVTDESTIALPTAMSPASYVAALTGVPGGTIGISSTATEIGGKQAIVPVFAVGSQSAVVGSTITVSNTPIAVISSASRAFYVVGSHGSGTEASKIPLPIVESSAAQPTSNIPGGTIEFTTVTTQSRGQSITVTDYVVGSHTAPIGSTVTVSSTPIAVITSASSTFYVIGTHGSVTIASTFAMPTGG